MIGHPIQATDIFSGVAGAFHPASKQNFAQSLKDLTGMKHAFLLNSGIASFYLILQVLKKLSGKKEVILPCYTAPSLVVAVLKAGLKPVLCDIALSDFNAECRDLRHKITQDTLAVVVVHMFGIPFEGVHDPEGKSFSDVFIIEDCAQAFGSTLHGRPVGSFGDVSFFSFNRGKNLPTYEGGAILTNSKELSFGLETELLKFAPPGLPSRITLGLKLMALSIAFRPFCYGLFYPLISKFKDNSVPQGFDIAGWTSFQAATGASLLKKCEANFQRRFENGWALIEALQGHKGLITPKIAQDSWPVFNRMPLVFEDKARLDACEKKILAAGIEVSRLYLKPLHHIFDLGYKKDDFPNAVFLAEGLLTLPVHPFVDKRDIEKMIILIKEG
jgi:dTDP-4-amino-4,6-dideoxygalactose transaminase